MLSFPDFRLLGMAEVKNPLNAGFNLISLMARQFETSAMQPICSMSKPTVLALGLLRLALPVRD